MLTPAAPPSRPVFAPRLATAIAATACLTAPALPAQTSDSTLLVRNVTLIHPETGATPGVDILVAGNRISAVGPTGSLAAPIATRSIDGSGRFAIPGLWDMHVHLSVAGESALPQFVAHGVLGVRDMGSDPWEPLRRYRNEALAGRRIGPRIAIAGPIVDGPTPSWPLRITAESPEQGRAAVDSLAVAGTDFVKVHAQLDRPTYFAIAQHARRLGMPFAGHVPNGVTGLEALAAGQRSLEHLTGIPPAGTPAFDSTAKALVERGAWVTPTLLVYWNLTHREDAAVRNDPRIATISESAREFWETQKQGWSGDLSDAIMQRMLASMRSSTGALASAGVKLLAATDLAFVFTYPGSSLHDELGLLVEAGLSPLQAIAAATVEPARFLGRERELGLIAPGWFADLVLLDADPLADIANTRRIAAVIANGRLFERAALDAMLAERGG